MIVRSLFTLVIAGLTLAAAPRAEARDSVFGSFFGGDAPAQRAERPNPENREREARNLRREYWERERARQSQRSDVPSVPLATEVSERGAAR